MQERFRPQPEKEHSPLMPMKRWYLELLLTVANTAEGSPSHAYVIIQQTIDGVVQHYQQQDPPPEIKIPAISSFYKKLATLTKMGLLEANPNSSDRRANSYTVTPLGLEQLEGYMDFYRRSRRMLEAMAQLSDEEDSSLEPSE